MLKAIHLCHLNWDKALVTIKANWVLFAQSAKKPKFVILFSYMHFYTSSNLLAIIGENYKIFTTRNALRNYNDRRKKIISIFDWTLFHNRCHNLGLALNLQGTQSFFFTQSEPNSWRAKLWVRLLGKACPEHQHVPRCTARRLTKRPAAWLRWPRGTWRGSASRRKRKRRGKSEQGGWEIWEVALIMEKCWVWDQRTTKALLSYCSLKFCSLSFDVSRLRLRTPLTLFLCHPILPHHAPHSAPSPIHSSPPSFPLSPLPLSLQRLKRYEEYQRVHAPIEDTRFAFWRWGGGSGEGREGSPSDQHYSIEKPRSPSPPGCFSLCH